MRILVQQPGHRNRIGKEAIPEPAGIALAGAVRGSIHAPPIAGVEYATKHTMRGRGDKFGSNAIGIKCPCPGSLRILKQRLLVREELRRLSAPQLHVQVVLTLSQMVDQRIRIGVDQAHEVVGSPRIGRAVIQRDQIGVGQTIGKSNRAVTVHRRAQAYLLQRRFRIPVSPRESLVLPNHQRPRLIRKLYTRKTITLVEQLTRDPIGDARPGTYG